MENSQLIDDDDLRRPHQARPRPPSRTDDLQTAARRSLSARRAAASAGRLPVPPRLRRDAPRPRYGRPVCAFEACHPARRSRSTGPCSGDRARRRSGWRSCRTGRCPGSSHCSTSGSSKLSITSRHAGIGARPWPPPPTRNRDPASGPSPTTRCCSHQRRISLRGRAARAPSCSCIRPSTAWRSPRLPCRRRRDRRGRCPSAARPG